MKTTIAKLKTRITHLFFLVLLIPTGCSTGVSHNSSDSANVSLPNIVLIIGDDQGYPYFGFMGADYVETPNMDSLAASGTLFVNGYVPANHCRPSLQSLITGTLPEKHNRAVDSLIYVEKQRLGPEKTDSLPTWERDFRHKAMQHFLTLPKLLHEKGYVSFQAGKWWEFHFANGGFTEGMTTGWTLEDRKAGSQWFKKFMGGEGLAIGRKTMQPVLDFVSKNDERPFFLWFAPELPHYPFDAPDAYYQKYADKNMTESAKRYYANCTWFDDSVGKLISSLKKQGKYSNTLFVYVNDNGWEQEPDQEFRHDSMRWHNGGDKGKLSMYDQSFRSPIIFSWENIIDKKTVRQALIHSTDIPATILDFVGISKPEDYYGISFKEIILGEDSDLRPEIIGSVSKLRSEADVMGRDVEGYWLRNKDWFFNWNVTDGLVGLYDMQTDQANDKDLSEQHPKLVEDFKEKIIIWKND